MPETSVRRSGSYPIQHSAAQTLGALIALMLVAVAAPFDAKAYLDPGTGSYLIQVVAAVLMGSVFTLKLYWAKVKSFFKSSTESTNETEDE